jgi:hypothetical protein
MKSTITLTAKSDLIDEGARSYLSQLAVKIDTLNERTKKHTIEIQELRKLIKEKKK